MSFKGNPVSWTPEPSFPVKWSHSHVWRDMKADGIAKTLITLPPSTLDLHTSPPHPLLPCTFPHIHPCMPYSPPPSIPACPVPLFLSSTPPALHALFTSFSRVHSSFHLIYPCLCCPFYIIYWVYSVASSSKDVAVGRASGIPGLARQGCTSSPILNAQKVAQPG